MDTKEYTYENTQEYINEQFFMNKKITDQKLKEERDRRVERLNRINEQIRKKYLDDQANQQHYLNLLRGQARAERRRFLRSLRSRMASMSRRNKRPSVIAKGARALKATLGIFSFILMWFITKFNELAYEKEQRAERRLEEHNQRVAEAKARQEDFVSPTPELNIPVLYSKRMSMKKAINAIANNRDIPKELKSTITPEDWNVLKSLKQSDAIKIQNQGTFNKDPLDALNLVVRNSMTPKQRVRPEIKKYEPDCAFGLVM